MADSNAITQADFDGFKIEIKKELSDIADKLESKIDKQMTSFMGYCFGQVF